MKKKGDVFVVERSFEEPLDLDRIQEQERRGAWCFTAYRVRFLRTYVAADGKRMICLYEAPDAEAVRVSQRKAGLPFDRVWAAEAYEEPPEG